MAYCLLIIDSRILLNHLRKRLISPQTPVGIPYFYAVCYDHPYCSLSFVF
jgi:hypothetical protein